MTESERREIEGKFERCSIQQEENKQKKVPSFLDLAREESIRG